MLRLGAIFGIAVLGLALIATPPATAQGRRAGGAHRPPARSEEPKPEETPIDEFQKMSPEQREKSLAKLPPDRAAKIRKQLDVLDKMTPEQRAAVREQLALFRQLPPEKQQALRKAFDTFSKEPADRQQAMRAELNQLRAMPQGDRQARIASPEVKSRFNKREQKILAEMSSLLPER